MERARHLCPLLALGVPGRVNRHSRGDRRQCRETDRRADEYATGLLYIEPDKDDFCTLLNMTDEPLAFLPLEWTRPGKEALDEIMESLR